MRCALLFASIVLAGCVDAPLDSARWATLSPAPTWQSDDASYSEGVDAADWNGDGLLDLAIGGGTPDEDGGPGDPNRVYQGNGDGTFDLVWSSPDDDATRFVAWADMDGDGDPDLATANDGVPDRVYENVGGELVSVWQSSREDASYGVQWADWDGDGDPDLTIASIDGPNVLYENVDGMLDEDPVWISPHDDEETSAAVWGDMDNDGDLDLAVANEPNDQNRVYRNDGGELVSVWVSDRSYTSVSAAWGDMDGDGYPEIIFMNEWQGHTIYDNVDGELDTEPMLERLEDTKDVDNDSVQWADFDGDGLLDFAVAGHQRDRVWRNLGNGDFDVWWKSPISTNAATDLEVADFDGDGDLEIVVSMASGRDALFDNLGPDPQEIVDNDGDGVFFPNDCDDTDPDIGTGPEICNGADDDCDGILLPEERDEDRDGAGPCNGDCEENNPERGLNLPEVCDGVDNDCDEVVPEDELDGDGDGFAPCEGDCDDADAEVLPEDVECGGTPPVLDPTDCECSQGGGSPALALLPLLLVRRRRS